MVSDPDLDVAPYATRSTDCGGRAHLEPDDPLRSPFELDRYRIIESTAFRRLEGKTQVFAPSHHDHFRTRLTHTLEAAQIARCLAVALQANESLAEAITLAHDLGHPPFGHAGEAALSQAMVASGGFNHNTHSVRVVEYLEHPFPAFRGLNLTAETLAGLRAHETGYDMPTSVHSPGDSRPGGASVDAQIASMADRIAYDTHDLEDAIGAGFVGLTELSGVTLWQQAYEEVTQDTKVENIHAIRRVVLDAMLNHLLTDVVNTSLDLLKSVSSPQQVRESNQVLVTMSSGLDAQLGELEQFLRQHAYGHPTVAEMDARGRRMVLALFDAYRTDPASLPSRFAARIDEQGLDRVICDYLAGMTDRFCTNEHDRLAQP